MRDFSYKIFSILILVVLFVVKWTLQLDFFGYDFVGHEMGFFVVVLQDVMLFTVFPSIVLIIAILLTSKKIASKVIAITNLVLTIFVLIYDTISYNLMFYGTDVFWSKWIYLVNIVPLVMTIIHLVKLSKKPSEGLVSYDI